MSSPSSSSSAPASDKEVTGAHVAPAHASPPPQDGLPPGIRGQALFCTFAAVTMSTLDTAITNTALPTIASSIGTDSESVIWVVNAYQLATLAALLPAASLGEILGHRRVYMAGLILFTITSLACGLAWSLPTLAAARALQGLGAAGIMSVNAALIRFIYPSRMLGRGVGYNAMVVSIAFTVGPTVASAILSMASWHWLFLVNVPVGLISIWFGWRSLPVTKRGKHAFDTLAALYSAGLLLLLIGGFSTIAHSGAWSLVLAEWAGAAICAFLLIRRQAGHPAPMLALDLLKRPVFALSSLTSICSFAVQGCAFVAIPFLLQDVLGHSTVATGFLMTPWPLVVAFMAPIAGRLADKYPPGLLGCGGLAVLCIGMATMALMPANPSTFDIVWRMLLCGAGFGFFQAPNLKAIMGSAPPERAGGASGIIATSRLTGQTLGAAFVALCFHAVGVPSEGPAIALWLGCAFAFAGSVMSGLRLLPGFSAPRKKK